MKSLSPRLAECGERPVPCTGIIEIVRYLAMATIELVAQIPLAGAVVKATLPPLINGMLDAIANGSVTAIQAAYALLDAPVSLLESILLIGNVATIPILPGRMQSDPGLHGCQLLGNRGSYSIRCHERPTPCPYLKLLCYNGSVESEIQ